MAHVTFIIRRVHFHAVVAGFRFFSWLHRGADYSMPRREMVRFAWLLSGLCVSGGVDGRGTSFFKLGSCDASLWSLEGRHYSSNSLW